MQFLKTLFWVALAVILVLFATANWTNVVITLWGGLEADVKLPALLLVTFLLGLVPIALVYRARIWTLRRRLDALERQTAAASTPTPAAEPVEPDLRLPEERVATDSKVWPTA